MSKYRESFKHVLMVVMMYDRGSLRLKTYEWCLSIPFAYAIRAVAGQRSSPDLCFATKFIKIYDP